MQVQDLTGIGRLGGQDSKGYFHLLVKPEFKAKLSSGLEVYLIFNSDRVFYVTICDIRESDNKIWVKFSEDGVAEERPLHKEAVVAIYNDDADEESPELDYLIGASVIFEGLSIGSLESYFHNGAQYVLEVQTILDSELLIPYVDYYVEATIATPPTILLQNATALLEAEGLKVEAGSLQRFL